MEVKVSAKHQVVIPKAARKKLRLPLGSRMVVKKVTPTEITFAKAPARQSGIMQYAGIAKGAGARIRSPRYVKCATRSGTRFRMVTALDSNVFIAFLEGNPNRFFTAAANIMQDVEHGALSAVYSSIVFGEVMRMPAGESLEPIKQLFASLGGKDYPAGRDVCIKAAELRRAYPALRLPDALHLATAIIARADKFITADKRLLAVAKQEITSTYLPDFATLRS